MPQIMSTPTPPPPSARTPFWNGVFPAVTTQMFSDGDIDVASTMRHVEVLVASGVTGIVILGSLGENQALTPDEKRELVAVTVATIAGRVPVLAGTAEPSTAAACAFARDCAQLGVSGLMLMPPMIYRSPDRAETAAFLRTVADASALPIMLYNNPISYGHDIAPEMLGELADESRFVAVKESSGDPRRITDIRNLLGDRYALFTGVDDLLLESAVAGIDGWVAGSGIAFPRENQLLWELTRRGAWEAARAFYRWFAPLLHLDTHPKFVQNIKLAVQERGLGAEWVRPPRLPLAGEERARVLGVIGHAVAHRPDLDALAL
jgi:4-hydroxy-tetrahydrodipicolinate synthase